MSILQKFKDAIDGKHLAILGIFINSPMHTIILGEARDLKIRIEYPAPYMYSLWRGGKSLFDSLTKYEDFDNNICYETDQSADFLSYIKNIY